MGCPLYPKSGHVSALGLMSAKCQKRTSLVVSIQYVVARAMLSSTPLSPANAILNCYCKPNSSRCRWRRPGFHQLFMALRPGFRLASASTNI
jgi:hypothetical protein